MVQREGDLSVGVSHHSYSELQDKSSVDLKSWPKRTLSGVYKSSVPVYRVSGLVFPGSGITQGQ